MSNHPRRYKLSEFREQRTAEAGIVIETDDGQEFMVPPAELWPDEFRTVARTGDPIAMARCVLGDERFDAFIAAGGTARVLDAIIADAQGVKAGESSASTGS